MPRAWRGVGPAHPSESNWPTLEKEGVPHFEFTVWSGLFVQKGVPTDIVRKLVANGRAVRIMRDTGMNEAIVKQANLHQ